MKEDTICTEIRLEITRNMDKTQAIQIPTITVDFIPDCSPSTTCTSSMTISLPSTCSRDSCKMNLVISSGYSSERLRLSSSEPDLMETERKLIFQPPNER